MATRDAPPRERSPSHARDHLANERTHLAWMRTAATVIALGLAIAKFAEDNSPHATAAGVILVVVGVAGIAYGTQRYRTINRELERGEYVTGTSGLAVTIVGVVLIAAVLAALALLLV